MWNSKQIKVNRSEVKITIRHNDYFYSVNDYSLNGQTVNVYYDEADLSTVHIFNANNQPLYTLEQKVLPREAQANQTQRDVNAILGQTSHNKAFDKHLKEDGKRKTKAFHAAYGDTALAMLNPLQATKEEINDSETEQLLRYMRENNNINPAHVPEYAPVCDEQGGELSDRFKKKHVSKPSLTIRN